MTEVIRHICWVKATYKITKRGRKWLQAVNLTIGQKPYCDKILINGISQEWQPEEVRDVFAAHFDEMTSFGHKVVLIPVTEEDYYSAPVDSRF